MLIWARSLILEFRASLRVKTIFYIATLYTRSCIKDRVPNVVFFYTRKDRKALKFMRPRISPKALRCDSVNHRPASSQIAPSLCKAHTHVYSISMLGVSWALTAKVVL